MLSHILPNLENTVIIVVLLRDENIIFISFPKFDLYCTIICLLKKRKCIIEIL